MATAKVDLVVDFGESWKFLATFPAGLLVSASVVDIEILESKNNPPETAYIKLSTSDSSVSLTGDTVSFLVTHEKLQRKLKPKVYHWRFYITWQDSSREEIMGGNFNYRETF